MISKIHSFGVFGLEAYPVEIEVDVASGLPAVTLVGLTDTAIKESKERVRSAIKNSGFKWPAQRITVNLAPSDVKKEGSCFDLPIALGILASSGQIDPEILKNHVFLGELSLDGQVKPVRGILAIGLSIAKSQIKNFVIPALNSREAAMVPGLNVYPQENLKSIAQFLTAPCLTQPIPPADGGIVSVRPDYDTDFSKV